MELQEVYLSNFAPVFPYDLHRLRINDRLWPNFPNYLEKSAMLAHTFSARIFEKQIHPQPNLFALNRTTGLFKKCKGFLIEGSAIAG